MSTIATFHEVLKGLPRAVFNRCVEQHRADKGCKRFRHWDHLLAMVYAQLSGASSLRTLELGFNSHGMHHRRLRTTAIHRSTVAWANERRSAAVFNDTAAWLMGKVSRRLRQEMRPLMCLLDSTSITLKGHEFDCWTLKERNRNTQGIKLHVLLDSVSHTPLWHDFSAPNVNDVTQAWQVPLQGDTLYVFDKGYCDYNWWARIDAIGSCFVTRLKSNAGTELVEELAIPDEAQETVLCDQLVRFKYTHLGKQRRNHYDKVLRRVTINRPGKTIPLILVTNDLDSSAVEIGQHYKQRWEIELFFKWLKQHLKIKSFLGRSRNAVHIQIVTALISYLLVALYKQAHRLAQTLWHCLSLITATLFEPPVIDIKSARTRPKRARRLTLVAPGADH
jgi:putative transposase